MADNGVVVEGLDELMQAFENFPAIAHGEVRAAMEKALMLLQAAAADYPQQRQGSTYRRTGTLGRLWTSATREITQGRHELEGRVGNATPYGPYVQDEDMQVTVHRGRWKTTKQIIAENEEAVDALLAQAGANVVEEMAR